MCSVPHSRQGVEEADLDPRLDPRTIDCETTEVKIPLQVQVTAVDHVVLTVLQTHRVTTGCYR